MDIWGTQQASCRSFLATEVQESWCFWAGPGGDCCPWCLLQTQGVAGGGRQGLRLPWFGQHAGQGSADCPSTEIGDVSHDKPGMTGLGRSAAFLSMSRPRTVPWLILKTWPGSPGYGVLVSVSRHLCFLEVALQPTPRLEHPLEGAAPMGAWVLSGRSRLTTDDDNL